MAKKKGGLKAHLMTAVRLIVAVLGIGYIAMTITWQDQVRLPAGYPLPGGQVLAEPVDAAVVEGDFHHPDQPDVVILLTPSQLPADLTATAPDQGVRLTIDKDQLDAGQGSPEAKLGILNTLRHAPSPHLLWVGLLIIAPVYVSITLRWWTLMRARQLGIGLWRTFRLSMIGNFFNYCMPGTTGGDLVKAFYAAKRPSRRTDAVLSVFVDRIAGLLGLILLAGLAGLTMLLLDPDAPDVVAHVTTAIWILIACLVVGGGIYFSHLTRRLLKLDVILAKLPGGGMLKNIDEAAMAYRSHPAAAMIAIGLSMVVHACLALGTATAGYALGIEHPLGLMLVVVPVLFFGAAVPISYQGLGIMEGLATPLLVDGQLCTANQMVGMLLLTRLYQVAYSMIGSIFLLQGDIHMHPQQHEADDMSQTPGTNPA